MSAEDELLSNFFASINKLSAAQSSPKPEENDVIITSTKFEECSDPVVKKSVLNTKPKEKFESVYTPPKFVEVDPETKKQERLEKFFKTEVENKNKLKQHRRRANGESWVDPTYPIFLQLSPLQLFVGNLGREVTTEILSNLFRMKYPSFTMARVVESKVHKGSAGYGFVAFSNALEGVKALKEMNGKLCGNRPMKIKRSEWQKKEESVISLITPFGILHYHVRKKERKEKKEIKAIAKARGSIDYLCLLEN